MELIISRRAREVELADSHGHGYSPTLIILMRIMKRPTGGSAADQGVRPTGGLSRHTQSKTYDTCSTRFGAGGGLRYGAVARRTRLQGGAGGGSG
jgi:hypothetical protein